MKNDNSINVDFFITSLQFRFSNFEELMLLTLFNTARFMTTSLLNAQFSAFAHFDQVTSHLTERNRLKKNDQSLWKIVN